MTDLISHPVWQVVTQLHCTPAIFLCTELSVDDWISTVSYDWLLISNPKKLFLVIQFRLSYCSLLILHWNYHWPILSINSCKLALPVLQPLVHPLVNVRLNLAHKERSLQM